MRIALEQVLNFESLGAALVFANTPAYLYTRFRDDPSVRALGINFSTNEILEELRPRVVNTVNNLAGAVEAYSLLISLSYKPAHELAGLKNISANGLEWFEKVKQFVFDDALRTQTVVLRVKPPTKMSVQPRAILSDPPNFAAGLVNRGGPL